MHATTCGSRHFRAVLFAATLSVVTAQAEALTIADLPAAGDTLRLTQSDTLSIAAGESARLDGIILIESVGGSPAELTITNAGIFSFGPTAALTVAGGRLDFDNQGSLLGDGLAVNARNGAQVTWSNTAGNGNLGRVAIHSEGSNTVCDVLDLPQQLGTLSADNQAADLNLRLQHAYTVGQFESSCSSSGVTNVALSGDVEVDGFVVDTFGGNTNVSNTGSLHVGSWKVTHQDDSTNSQDTTNIYSSGQISGGDWDLIAAGASGVVNAQIQDSVDLQSLCLDANYGGTINVDTLFAGDLHFANVSIDASGASHGNNSEINLFNGADAVIEHLKFSWDEVQHEQIGGVDHWTFTQHAPRNNLVRVQNVGNVVVLPEPSTSALAAVAALLLLIGQRTHNGRPSRR